jgi:hypothetical protein
MKREMKLLLRPFPLSLCLLTVPIFWNGLALTAEDPAVAAARKRQEAIKSFDIEFKRTEVIPQGWFTKEPKGALPGPRPEKDVTLESVNRVVVDGKKFRFEDNHPIRGILEFASSRLVCSFDGTFEKGWFHHGTRNQSVPTGWIKIGTREGILSEAAMRPIWLSVAIPYSEVLPYNITSWKPTGATRVIDNTKDLEYEIRRSRGATRFYLDPSKDSAICRIENEVEGAIQDGWDIKNRRVEPVGWLPDSWVYTSYENGQLRRSSNVQITRIRLNEPMQADLFDVQFPEGTHVFDARDRKDYRANADGTLREVSLLDEKQAEIRPERRLSWFARNRWLNFGIAMTLLIVLLIIRFRRRPARRMKALPFD